MKFIKFPSINQFRNVIKGVEHIARYKGYDSDKNRAIIDPFAELPTLKFIGTVKIHGTNAGVCYDPKTGEVWAQNRRKIITVDKDNAGFAYFVESNKSIFIELFQYYYDTELMNPMEEVVTLYGEWCGRGIQKGTAVNQLDKMFVIFKVRICDNWFVPIEEATNHTNSIYNVTEFGTYEIDIDFAKPELSQNKLVELTQEVEGHCPVGDYFGVTGVGEGIVWHCDYKGNHLMFKVTGHKHSSSKVKKLANVNIDVINSINEFVEYAVSENRLNQAIEQVFISEAREPDIDQFGLFIKWVKCDIIKEEIDILKENKLEPKQVLKGVSLKVRKWFFEKYTY